MIAQILLSLGLLSIAFYGVAQRSRSRIVMYVMVAVCIAGEVLVVAPSLSTQVAHVLGIGRGADLILYCFIIASLALNLGMSLRILLLQQDITELVRTLALSGAEPSATESRKS